MPWFRCFKRNRLYANDQNAIGKVAIFSFLILFLLTLKFGVGNGLLTLMSNMFTNLNLTDMETCYKVFRREIIQSIKIEENRFGFEPEITAKVAKLNCRIFEVGISYYGRTYDEGKKIGWRDGVRAIYCIIKYS